MVNLIPVPLPNPVLESHNGITVVRDDLLPGGTKRRAIHVLFDSDHDEYVYASPVYGYAQVALAYAARDYSKHAMIFCAERKTRHPLTLEAMSAGAQVREIPAGYLTVVRSYARRYCDARNKLNQPGQGARLLPFGLDEPAFVDALADVARRLPVKPEEVWSVVGSGVLTRALQQAWPEARFFGVRIGAEPDAGECTLLLASEKFEQPAVSPPPFPSCPNYDAKAWRFLTRYASPGALFWNVAS